MSTDVRLTHDVTEPELRRYLRHASILLGCIDPDTAPLHERTLLLRRARHWLRAAQVGVDQLLRDAEAIPSDEIEDPLTPAVNVVTIGAPR